MNSKLAHYLRRGAPVYGWVDVYSARFIADLSDAQVKMGLKGGLGEIGVQCGRLYIILKLCAQPGERTVAIDVFHLQHLNLDKSGRGDEAKFRSNLRRWTGDDDIETIIKSSLEIKPEDIRAKVGPVRMMSIDGCHTHECTVNDLRLVEGALIPEGIVILDDLFLERWPSVLSGAIEYMNDHKSQLKMFAITPEKTYWARPEFHAQYQRMMAETNRRFFDRTVPFMGLGVDIYYADRRIRGRIKQSPLGPFAKRIQHWVERTFYGY